MKSYRIDQPRPKPKRRTMQMTTTPGTMYMHNGCSADMAIPCWYMEVRKPIPAAPHDRMRHDMIGWPTPDHPDHCCQEWDFDRHHCRRTPHLKCCPPKCEHFIDMRRLIPIHLSEEGYDGVSVTVLDSSGKPAAGITAEGSIDETDDWIVRIRFKVSVEDAMIPSDDPVSYYYSVRVDMRDASSSDLVTIGRLVVLPAPWEAE